MRVDKNDVNDRPIKANVSQSEDESQSDLDESFPDGVSDIQLLIGGRV